MSEERYAKQVLVVRKDLTMRKGKIAAQCAHASMRVLLDLMDRNESDGTIERRFTYPSDGPLGRWVDGRFKKICVYVNSEEELDAIAAEAESRGMLHALIVDRGLTEFGGVPTKTVVAVGPAWEDEVNDVTGHLKLL